MTTLALHIDLKDRAGLAETISLLQMFMGKGLTAAPPAAAASTGTVKAGAALGQTAGAHAQAAASAADQSQVSTAATGDAGNATSGGNAAQAFPNAAAAASPQALNATAAAAEVTFDVLKAAFLAYNSKNGRPATEAMLKGFGLGKLSEAKPEQYAAIKAEMEKA